MKTQIEIEDRIREILKQELRLRVGAASLKLPHHCVHNHQQPLDTRRQVEGEPNAQWNRITRQQGLPVLQTMGLCMLGSEHAEDWQGTICDEPLDAQRCPLFQARQAVADVDEEFRTQTQDAEWVRENLPEVHVLLWALESPSIPAPTPEVALAVVPATAPATWWQRFLRFWRR